MSDTRIVNALFYVERVELKLPDGVVTELLVPTFSKGVEKILELWRKWQIQRPTVQRELEIKAMEYVEAHYKRQQKQLIEADTDIVVIGVDVSLSRKLTSEEKDVLNGSEKALGYFTDLLYKYDPDCRWTDGEWTDDGFHCNLTDEGMDAKSAIIFGYAIDELLVMLSMIDIQVEYVDFIKKMTDEEVEAQAEMLRRKFRL